MKPPLTGWCVPGPDGTRLLADVQLPAGTPAPTVVLRTPYGRAQHRAEGRAWAERGFAFVVQDVRGRYDSDGTWELYAHERGDGAALVDAVTAQHWSDGTVVTTGGSYAAFTAWTAAVERPAAVRAVLSTGAAMGLHRVKWDPSGVLRLAEHATWWLERAGARTTRDGAVHAALAADPHALSHLPVLDLPQRLRADLPGWADVVRAGPDARPADEVTDAELAGFPGAALHVGGWYDLLVDETLRHWDLVGSGCSPRPPRRLLLGPWDHSFGWGATTRVGAREHGSGTRRAHGELQFDWLRQVLQGQAISGTEVFEVGAGWRRAPHWPPPARTASWWPTGDGTLSPHAPREAPVRLVHNPADPFPSAGAGADRHALLTRTDALRFAAAPLGQDLHLAGTPVAQLTSSGDGDRVVRLLEQQGDGALLSLSSGCTTEPTARVPMTALSVRVPAGSSLVLEVTGADFPHLARHLGGPDRYAASGGHPSQLVLCVGPGTRLDLPVAQP